MTLSPLTEWFGLGSRQGQEKIREALALVAMQNKTTNEGRPVLCVNVAGYFASFAGNHGVMVIDYGGIITVVFNKDIVKLVIVPAVRITSV